MAIFPYVNPAPALAGTTTLTTYYPAPNGNYNHMSASNFKVVSQSNACSASGSDEAMVNDNGDLQICNAFVTAITVSGSNVGIGNRSPQATLDVSGNIQINGNKLIGLATPTNDTDAANKAYVDAAKGGGGGGCYVTYYNYDQTASCLPGFTNKGSNGWWGYCRGNNNTSAAYLPPGGSTCPGDWVATMAGYASVCCQ